MICQGPSPALTSTMYPLSEEGRLNYSCHFFVYLLSREIFYIFRFLLSWRIVLIIKLLRKIYQKRMPHCISIPVNYLGTMNPGGTESMSQDRPVYGRFLACPQLATEYPYSCGSWCSKRDRLECCCRAFTL